MDSLLKWVAVISVLYIDSDPVLLDSGKRFLERETTIQVDIAHTATEALERLMTGSFDAIISDHTIPEIDSIHLLKIVRQKFPKLPFIIFTGNGSDEIFIEALNHGADDFIKKCGDPKFQFAVLSYKIKRAVEFRELRQKDEKFHRLFDTTDYGIIILDTDTRKIIDANSFIVTLTGYSLEYLLGRNLGEIGFSKEAMPAEQFFTELEKTGYIHYKDIPLVTKSGKIIDVEFISKTTSLNGHQVIQYSIYDITDRKRAESARILSRKNLDMFSSMIRHDILNQLMVVSGSLELAGYGIQEPDLLKHLARAQTATKTIQRQIIFTREYENLGADTPTWQQVSTIIRRAFLEVETESIILNIEQDSPDVFADPLFEKVFYHLFNYSCKYGEKVSLIEVTFHYTTAELIITVADDGIGISPENKDHLFEWRSGNEKTPGLFLAQKILASTGITIKETGEFKKGTRFEIIVPRDGFQTGSRQHS